MSNSIKGQSADEQSANSTRNRMLSRRRALFGGAAVVAGAGAAAVIGGSPAQAASGNNMVIGQVNAATGSDVTILQNDVGKIVFGDSSRGAIVGQTLGSATGRAGVVGTTSLLGNTGVAAQHTLADGAPLMIFPHTAVPTAGAHQVGEVTSVNGTLYVCVAGGTPGTWANVGFNPITPLRLLDTRHGIGLSGTFGPGQTRTLTVAPHAPIPAAAKAVAFNVTVVGPTAGGWLTIWPAGVSMPTASNINFTAGQTVANFATVKLGTGSYSGKMNINNAHGYVNVIIDVAGYYI